MALWDLEKIIAEVRGLSMKRSLNQISKEDIIDKINQYIFYKFPQDVNPPELHDFYEFTTSSGVQDYEINQDLVSSFSGSVFISEDDNFNCKGTIWFDSTLYYEAFPTNNDDVNSEPTDFLIYSGKITVTPIPDGIYYIKMPCVIRPNTLENDTDIPSASGREYEKWGSVIAHGAAVDILEKSGEDDRLNQVSNWYLREKLSLKKEIVFQNTSKRPICKF